MTPGPSQRTAKDLIEVLRRDVRNMRRSNLTARDNARAAGRELVAECRQSDVETLDWVLRRITEIKHGQRQTPRGSRR